MNNESKVRQAWAVLYDPDHEEGEKYYLTSEKAVLWTHGSGHVREHSLETGGKGWVDVVRRLRGRKMFNVRKLDSNSSSQSGRRGTIEIKPKLHWSETLKVNDKRVKEATVVYEHTCRISLTTDDSYTKHLVCELLTGDFGDAAAAADGSQRILSGGDDEYRLVSRLRRTRSGAGVYKAYAVRGERFCTVKTGKDCEEGSGEWVRAEHELLTKIDHPNIAKSFALMSDEGWLFTAGEFARGGSLHHLIYYGERQLDEADAKPIFRQVVAGLCHLHNVARAVHGDVRPECVMLYDGEGEVRAKLVDFPCGFVAHERDREHFDRSVHEFRYSPPELLRSFDLRRPHAHARPGDVWGVGASLFVALTRSAPFRSHINDAHEYRKQMLQRRLARSDRYEELSRAAKRLIRECLQPNAERRATIEQIVEMRWF